MNSNEYETVVTFNSRVYEKLGDDTELANFHSKSNEWFDQVYFGDNLIYCSENSDRGWDDTRTVEEQAILELETLRDNINKVLSCIKK